LKQISATIISNKPTNEYPVSGRPSTGPASVIYRKIIIEAPDIASEARPGQFVTVSCGSGVTLRRPLSIHRVDNSNQLSILFAVVGNGTQWLSQRLKGETLDMLGPLGNGFSVDPDSQSLLLLAGGIGIAPLAFLAQQALAQKKSVTLLLGARTVAGLYPQQLLPDGINTFTVTEDGSDGIKGMITDILPEFESQADQIYACGPKAMYQAMAKKGQQTKKPIQISLEVRMGCGLGACYSCSIETEHGLKQVCHDGPVFNLDEINWEKVQI